METKLSKIRESRNLSQQEVAEKLNISLEDYIEIENGNKEKLAPLLKSLADIFNISSVFLTFLSIERDDIEPHKQELYDIVYPSIEELSLLAVNDK